MILATLGKTRCDFIALGKNEEQAKQALLNKWNGYGSSQFESIADFEARLNVAGYEISLHEIGLGGCIEL